MLVTLLPERVDDQFQQNLERHIYAKELVIKVEQLGKCFTRNTALPPPSAEISAAWNDIPNDVIQKPKWPLPPPSTPTRFNFVKNEARLEINHCDGTPSPDSTASTVDRCWPQNDHSTSCYRPADQSSDQQSSEGPSFPSTESSDLEGAMESWKEVRRWLMYYREHGAETFVQSLIRWSAQSSENAQLGAQIACAVTRKVHPKDVRPLRKSIRFAVVAAFKERYWPHDFQTIEETTGIPNTQAIPPNNLHLASFMGSLFAFNLAVAGDVHECLNFLMKEKSLDRLCAIHELLSQADDKLCKRRYVKTILEFQRRITVRDEVSGEYLWARSNYAKKIVEAINMRVEQWKVRQAEKRDAAARLSGKINIKVVGPRFHDTKVVVPALRQWP